MQEYNTVLYLQSALEWNIFVMLIKLTKMDLCLIIFDSICTIIVLKLGDVKNCVKKGLFFIYKMRWYKLFQLRQYFGYKSHLKMIQNYFYYEENCLFYVVHYKERIKKCLVPCIFFFQSFFILFKRFLNFVDSCK